MNYEAMIGCDPTIATRDDCVTYGIAPGIDAGAHGFARLRDGGAVDMRFTGMGLPRGAVVYREGESERRVILSDAMPALWHTERFIGLDARQARPEDVRRLCCGAAYNGDGGDSRRCTLAISDHDEHEDIATGVKWKAVPAARTLRDSKGESLDKFAEMCGVPPRAAKVCDACGCKRACPWHTEHKTDPDVVLCASCGCMWCGPKRCDSTMPGTNELARCSLSQHADGKHRDALGREWDKPMKQEDKMAVVSYTMRFSSDGTASVTRVTPEPGKPTLMGYERIARAFCDFFAGLKIWRASPPGQLVLRDAAVAKAIADVPAGCDPLRWANVVRVIAASETERACVVKKGEEYLTDPDARRGNGGRFLGSLAIAWRMSRAEASARCRSGGALAGAVAIDDPAGLDRLVMSIYETDAILAVREYARHRFVHDYSRTDAVRMVLKSIGCGRCAFTERLFAAYEAGR